MLARGNVRFRTKLPASAMSDQIPTSDFPTRRTDLVDRMDAAMRLVREHSLSTVNALTSANEQDFRRHLLSYRTALLAYQKLVRTELYNPLCKGLQNESDIVIAHRAEHDSALLIERANKLFAKSKADVFDHKMLFIKAYIRIARLLVKQHEKEKETLYPMLRRNLSI